MPRFDALRYIAVENIVRKGEISFELVAEVPS